MLRYHKYAREPYWAGEYGSADNPEQFKWLLGYSPYHRVKPGTRYPAVLLTRWPLRPKSRASTRAR